MDPLAQVCIGLSTTPPTETGENITEPVGWGYAPVRLSTPEPVRDPDWWRQREITFPRATGSWGIATHWFAADALGRVLDWGPLASAPAASEPETRYPEDLEGKTIEELGAYFDALRQAREREASERKR